MNVSILVFAGHLFNASTKEKVLQRVVCEGGHYERTWTGKAERLLRWKRCAAD